MSSVIRVKRKTKDLLDKFKIIPRETYDDVILRLIGDKRKKEYEERI